MRFILIRTIAAQIGFFISVSGLVAQNVPAPTPVAVPPTTVPAEPTAADSSKPAAPAPEPEPEPGAAEVKVEKGDPVPETPKEPEKKRIPLPLVPLEKLEGVPTYLPYETDSLGLRWDVRGVGGIYRGQNSLFDGALGLDVNGTGFTATQAFHDPIKHHLRVLGEVTGIEVTRDVIVDIERAGASFLDTFANPGKEEMEVAIRYTSGFSESMRDGFFTDSGKRFSSKLEPRDCGVLFFSSPSRGSRPSVIFLLADPKARLRPATVSARTSGFTSEWKMKLKPGESKSLLHVMLQRHLTSADGMIPQMKPMFRRRHLVDASVSSEMMPLVQNFHLKPPDPDGGNADRLVAINQLCDLLDVDREESDMLWMGKESMLRGKITGAHLKVAKAGGGELEIPLENVAVLRGGGGRGLQHKIYLRDGAVLVTDVKAAPMKLESPEGWSLDVAVEQLEYLVFHVDKADGKLPEKGTDYVRLHSGEIAIVDATEVVLKVISPWGDVELPANQVRMMRYLKEPTPRYRLELVDGSLFSAFVVNESMDLNAGVHGLWSRRAGEIAAWWKIDLLPDFDAEVDELDSLVGIKDKLCLLKGSNQIYGVIANEELNLVAGTTTTPLNPAEMRSIKRLEESYDEPLAIFSIELEGGDSLSGYFKERFIDFRTSSGRVWTLPMDQLMAVNNMEPDSEEEASIPATGRDEGRKDEGPKPVPPTPAP